MRNPEETARDATASADHPYRSCSRQADPDRRDAELDGAGRQTLLPGWRSCSTVLIHHCFADKHLEHSVDRLSDRQHCSHREICAAHRRHHHVSDDRFLWTLCAYCSSSAGAACAGASVAAHLCRRPTPGNLEWRCMVGPCGRCNGAGGDICNLYCAVGKSFSLGVAKYSMVWSFRSDDPSPRSPGSSSKRLAPHVAPPRGKESVEFRALLRVSGTLHGWRCGDLVGIATWRSLN